MHFNYFIESPTPKSKSSPLGHLPKRQEEKVKTILQLKSQSQWSVLCNYLRESVETAITVYHQCTIQLHHYKTLPLTLSHFPIIQLYHHSNVPLSHCTIIQLYHYPNVPLSHCTIIPLYHYATHSYVALFCLRDWRDNV